MIALVLLLIVVALGAAAAFGFTPDTRDPEHGLGPFFSPQPAPYVRDAADSIN